MSALLRGFPIAILAGCGPAVPPATDATGAPIAVAPAPSTAAPAATSDAGSASVGAPAVAGAATSQCDGRAGANLASGGKATASDASERPNEGAAAAFDDHTGTKWVARGTSAWLAYEFAGERAHVVTQYALSPVPTGTVGTDPVSFKLEGSNDAAGPWTTLHEHAGQRFVNRQATLWFSFENATAYRRVRLTISENGGGAGIELAELGLFGPGTPAFSVDDSLRGAHPNEFQYGPHWEHGTKDAEFSPPKYGSSSSWSKHRDASVSFAFVGSQVSLYGVRYPGHGIAAVSIDGGPETMVDFYGAAAGDTLFFTSPLLCPPQQRVLRVRTTGEKNAHASDAYVSIDRVRIVP